MGFFTKICGLLFGDAKTLKRAKLLKTIVRDIKNNYFKDFYRPFDRTLTPRFALYFYDIYEKCAQPQMGFKNTDVPAELKNAVLNHFLDNEAREIIERLEPEYLSRQSGSINSVFKEAYKDIEDLNKKLDYRWRTSVDKCYKLISSFIWIITFDYYILLKKFNHTLREFSFGPNPVFNKTPALGVVEHIKDFLSIAEGVSFDADWSVVFAVLGDFSKKMSVDITEEKKLDIFSKIQKVARSGILHMIIRHATGEPEWKNKIVIPHKMIAHPFLTEITGNAEKTLREILTYKKDTVIERYIMSVFGSMEILHGAKYYVDNYNDVYKGTGIEGFKYTAAFGYSIAFLSLYFGNLKNICDTFVIYGAWADPGNMRDLSQCLHELTILNEQLHSYDKTLSPSGERGSKLKLMEINSVQSRSHRNSLCRYLVLINDEILAMINHLITVLSSLNTFFTRVRENSEVEIAAEVVNIKTVFTMLKDKKCDMAFAEEKTADFLSLLTHMIFDG
ncbi:MAG: DUF5312 family protein [Spirochaetaceae bacterium]|jgi:hypothetical protein|nr:DUF5312 family protein [Spirochaetaceae bacterium]